MSIPLLSVCLITYNHVKYIREAIDGVLMQKVNFSWNLIIADDFSTDGTREILLEYKEKYPEFIKLILQEKNVGAAQNWLDLLNAPESKYIAYFEGDDYWTDPLKLQKQVDFLEANEGYTLCFHNAFLLRNNKDKMKPFRESSKNIYYTKDVIVDKWFCPTASIVFKSEAIKDSSIMAKNEKIVNGDMLLIFQVSLKGKLYFINEIMSVYRCNVMGGITDSQSSVFSKYKNYLDYLFFINKKTNNQFIFYIFIKVLHILIALIKNIIKTKLFFNK